MFTSAAREGDHRRVLASERRHTSHHARAATEWHHRDRTLRTHPQQRLELPGAVRVQHRVRRLRRFARAQAHEVGVALAGGVCDALGVIVAHRLGSQQRAQLRAGAFG
jgi:hypothetical protein